MKKDQIFRLDNDKSMLAYSLKGLLQNFRKQISSDEQNWLYFSPDHEQHLVAGESVEPNACTVACFILSQETDSISWLLTNSDRILHVAGSFSRCVFCVKPGQFLQLNDFFKCLEKVKASAEIQISLNSVVSTIDTGKRLSDAAVALISEAILASEKSKLKTFFTFSMTLENCFWGDDLNKIFTGQIANIVFFPSMAVLNNVDHLEGVDHHREAKFHLLMFFDNLARIKTYPLTLRLFYKRIVNSVEKPAGHLIQINRDRAEPKWYRVDGGMIGCSRPYNSARTSVTGNPLSVDYASLFFPALPEVYSLTRQVIFGKIQRFAVKKKTLFSAARQSSQPEQKSPADWRHVIITGWYGTETQGDKAILGEVLHFVKACSPTCTVTLTTIYPKISIQTNYEMADLAGVELISINEVNLADHVRKADAVIMGGGPIMETNEMLNVLRIFEEANRQEKARIIFGCGIGPFHTRRIIDVTIRVLQLTTAGFVRDKESLDYAQKLCPSNVLKFACDPAVAFVYRWKNVYRQRHGKLPVKENKIACLLRANTNEFAADKSAVALGKINQDSAAQIGAFLEPVCRELGYSADLLHMNAPWLGGDDRLFNRFVEHQFPEQDMVRNERRYVSLDDHLERMLTSEVGLAMRYHGHVFCLALGIPFVSIDYTGKNGKVGSLVRRIGYAEWSEEWSEIESVRATEKIKRLIQDKESIADYLETETSKLVDLLYKTYTDVFDIQLKF